MVPFVPKIEIETTEVGSTKILRGWDRDSKGFYVDGIDGVFRQPFLSLIQYFRENFDISY